MKAKIFYRGKKTKSFISNGPGKSRSILVLLMAATMVIPYFIQAQNSFPATGAAGIGTTTPNASSLLDITSTSKGILIPRMTKAQRDAIASPATGLLIYQTNSTPGFYYHDGTAWSAVSAPGVSKKLNNLTEPTAVNVDLLPGITTSLSLGSSSFAWRDAYLNGTIFMNGADFIGSPGILNTFVGQKSGNSLTSGSSNTGTGAYALNAITDGNYNTATGGYSLYSNSTGYYNTANGFNALTSNTSGAHNTAVGFEAMHYNTLGSSGIATGSWALYSNTTGNQNTANGYRSLNSNTTGSQNTGNGANSLSSNTTGNQNTANGVSSLLFNTTGNYNTAIGSSSLYSNKIGVGNTAAGFQALYSNTANTNTAVGCQALYSNTTGYSNTANGYNSLYNNTTGSYNTAIGFNAGPSTAALTNATAIGYNASVDASNKVRIGNTSVTSIGGQVGWTTFSDGRYKKNIKEDVKGLVFINSLRTITYTVDVKSLSEHYNKTLKQMQSMEDEKISDELKRAEEEGSKIVYNGFVAQEVEAAAKKLKYDFSGVDKPQTEEGLYGLRYSDFVVPLVKAVQELSKMNDDKDEKINDLQKQIDELKVMIGSKQTTGTTPVNNPETNQHVVLSAASAAKLEQNFPNPFGNSTTIKYYLPEHNANAVINFYSVNGTLLKSVKLASTGNGSINVGANELSSGVYRYSLVIDGKLIDSKQMMHAK